MNFGIAKFFGAIDKRFQDKYNYLIDLLSKSVNTGGSSYPFTSMPYVGTAPIIESGSNADGNYIKYADGTMICTGTSTEITTPSSAGAVFYSDYYVWTYPVAFYDFPRITTSSEVGTGIVIGARLGTPTKTQTSCLLIGSAATDTGYINWIAIGRWKA